MSNRKKGLCHSGTENVFTGQLNSIQGVGSVLLGESGEGRKEREGEGYSQLLIYMNSASGESYSV